MNKYDFTVKCPCCAAMQPSIAVFCGECGAAIKPITDESDCQCKTSELNHQEELSVVDKMRAASLRHKAEINNR